AGPTLQALRKTFTPPPTKQAKITAPQLPEADGQAMGLPHMTPLTGPNLQPLKKTFTAPAVVARGGDATVLPEAPAAAALPPGTAPGTGPNLQPLRKSFSPPRAGPASARAQAAPADLPGVELA